MKQLILRWKAETPLFWKKVRNLSAALALSATAVVEVNVKMNLGLPETLVSVCGYIIAAGAALAVSSQLTTKS